MDRLCKTKGKLYPIT